ncbi:hypothetical protein SAMN04487974_13116 [Pelagibacterium luteolum]|uniref:Uncharacterized protein n=1 Tax=Pelagibacterium luteolum TaxID=440168 RepID=A0A1G8AJ03_9HYPH|nr:hypothetical protein SAMN04487974_13116 [Pelagibacterium luteolum]
MSWMSHSEIETVMKGVPHEVPADAQASRLLGKQRPGCRHGSVVV